MAKPRLVLVVPNYRWWELDQRVMWHYIPYNLCLLAAMVRDECEVHIIDAYVHDTSQEAFAEQIRALSPDVVGISVLMDQCAASGHLAAQITKSIDPRIKVLMGGVYPTVNADVAIRDANVDFVVIGEGEYVLQQLLRHFAGAGPLPQRGLCYRQGDRIVDTGRAELIDDLDALPRPAYDLIDYTAYGFSAPRKSVDAPPCLPFARIITSRGCPFHCVFCQVGVISGHRFRPRSAAHVLDEIAWLKDRYGIQSFIFDDDNLLVDRARAVEIFQGMIDRGLAMPWNSIATAVFHMDEELVKLMRASGCRYVDVAIESGTPRVLKEIIRKPVDLARAKHMIGVLRENGIFVAANFIVGFPTETWEEIRESLRVAGEMDADYLKIFGAIPLRHTRLWELCEKTGSVRPGYDSSRLTWFAGQTQSAEFSTDDLTILRAYEWDRLNFTDPEKRRRTAEMMQIDETELHNIRRDTLVKAIRQIRSESSP